MAFTGRDQAATDATDTVGRGGRVSPDGRATRDTAHAGPLTDATLAELIGRLINDLSDLADHQIELAKQEINDAKDQAIGAIKRLAIGAGVAAAMALLLVIWAWTAVIWFFNWLGAFFTVGPITLAWLGWLIGLVVPVVVAFFAFKAFIQGGLRQVKGIFPPLPRTRATLKEDLEWVRQQRTPSAR